MGIIISIHLWCDTYFMTVCYTAELYNSIVENRDHFRQLAVFG